MSIDRVGEAEVDRLQAAVFEQRRLAHMLRQRGVEIEALEAERERLVARERKGLEREERLREQVRSDKERLATAVAERDRLREAVETAELQAAQERERLRDELAEAQRQAAEERESLDAGLGQARYEVRRADRRVAKAEELTAEERGERDRLAEEVARLEREAGRRRHELEAAKQEVAVAKQEVEAAKQEVAAARHQLGNVQEEVTRNAEARAALETRLEMQGSELDRARYETRHAERRVAKLQAELVEQRKRSRLQVDALAGELREAVAARKEESARHAEESRRKAEEGQRQAEETSRLLDSARQLGQALREVELLLAAERECEVALVATDRTLAEVAEQLRRVQASRSWRWGHGLARLLRLFTFRRHRSASALDTALDRLQPEDRAQTSTG